MAKKKKFTHERVYHIVRMNGDGSAPYIVTYTSRKDRDDMLRKFGGAAIPVDGTCRSRNQRRTSMPFIAVNMDGNLTVDVFHDRRTAKKVYDKIKEQYSDSSTFEEGDWGFSVDQEDGPSVALGTAKIVDKHSVWEVS